MAPGQLALDVLDAESHLLEEDKEVIYEVGRLVGEAVAVAVHGLDHRLDGFLADLLGYLLDALDEETRGVGAFGHLAVALADEAGQGADEALVLGRVEAGGRAPVAGGTCGQCLDKQGIGVAVGIGIDDAEEVAAGLALRPKAPARAAVEDDAAFAHGLVESRFVHVAQHEDFERHGILHDDGQQAVGALRKVEIGESHVRVCFGWFRALPLCRAREGSP